ncbi:hypothetical protein ACFSKY_06445 [Azotobacter chroococcum]|uniref:Uncharacterized protein n=1 Tax=Azotobacter chroococcum TaxID=353 RepID=A0A4R1PRN3_9GAMM|nr:hypothetical protein [Azotobacter chroococcum]TBV91342.1 hypothetical protein E0E53_21655 [Azotobacter chroococcum]TCL32501.1 hypothetical protein EV691_10727 [Azotobacter chroococcum]
MNTVTLPSAARLQLAEQIVKNGTFIHGLANAQGVICCMAFVTVEQCDAATQVRVELGDSVNSVTLARRDDTGERVARFLEDVANGVTPSIVPEVDEYLLVGDLELTLREAIRLGRGSHYLPVDYLDLCLLLNPAFTDRQRTAFRFEVNGASLTLPLLLPTDRKLAYELLVACVHELVANYRSSAA